MCIDLWNLNEASVKENYPIPSIEKNLQIVSGCKLFSLLDGFSGYN